ncbi:MAG: hypothetical protein LKI32_06450 [Lachnospiraceae bacterium]|jgi:hypothetical protein|nr:hypothetical protein [Lachnospiraceae bacterium]MCI1657180.1 hypothetical protein [Lachnospiraceae bacterium]MCI2195603.1 hypothetical protein [Lachnospiraceae bacterium]
MSAAVMVSMPSVAAFAENGQIPSENTGTETVKSAVVYGTANLTYQQLYGNDRFDAITSATTKFLGRIANASGAIDKEKGTTAYTGVKNAYVAVDQAVYDSMRTKKEAGQESAYTASEAIAASMTVSEEQTAPPWYVHITENDSEGIQENQITDITDAKASITAPSAWGDYLVEIKESADSPNYLSYGKTAAPGTPAEKTIDFGNLIGATFTTDDGAVYTLGYMENLWTTTHEFSFRIAEDSSMVHMGNSTNWSQFADMPGKTITGLTYYTTDGAYHYDLTDSNLYVKKQLTAKVTGDSEVKVQSDGSLKVKVDASKLPDGFSLTSVGHSNGHGSNAIDASQYTYKDGVLTVTADGVKAAAVTNRETGETSVEGIYTAVFSDAKGNYVNAEYSFTVSGKENAGTNSGQTTVPDQTPAVKKAAKITTAQSVYNKTYKQKAFTLGAKRTGNGKLTYKTSNAKVASVSANGGVTIKGAGTAKITIQSAETSSYQAAAKTVIVRVGNAKQTMKVKVTKKTYSAKKLKKKAAKFSLGVSKAAGKVTYKSSSKNVKVSSKGVVTVKKGTKKKKYTITIKAAGNSNYASGSRKVTITVKK